jgi:hypothetical protein
MKINSKIETRRDKNLISATAVIFSLLSLFRKGGLWDHLAVCVFVSPQRMKAGIVETEGTAVSRQRLGKHVPAANNTHVTTEQLLDAVFSMR